MTTYEEERDRISTLIPKCRFCRGDKVVNMPMSAGFFGGTSGSNVWFCAECGKVTILPLREISK